MTRDRLLSALCELGDTPEKIAHSLEALLIRGIPNDAEHCPVAIYLQIEGAQYVAVCAECIQWNDDQVATPEAVADFVRQLDDGQWPQLTKAEIQRAA